MQSPGTTDSGWEESSTSPDSPNRSVGKGDEESVVAALAPQWEIGQRVKVAQKGEGTVLYVGKLPSLGVTPPN